MSEWQVEKCLCRESCSRVDPGGIAWRITFPDPLSHRSIPIAFAREVDARRGLSVLLARFDMDAWFVACLNDAALCSDEEFESAIQAIAESLAW